MIASKSANKIMLCLICTWTVLKNSSSPLSLGWMSCSASKGVLGCQHVIVMSYHKTSMPCNLYAGCNHDWLFVTDAWRHFQLVCKAKSHAFMKRCSHFEHCISGLKCLTHSSHTIKAVNFSFCKNLTPWVSRNSCTRWVPGCDHTN